MGEAMLPLWEVEPGYGMTWFDVTIIWMLAIGLTGLSDPNWNLQRLGFDMTLAVSIALAMTAFMARAA